MFRVKSYKAKYRQCSVDTSNYIMEQYDIKSQITKTQITGKHWRKNTLMQKNKQTNEVMIIIVIISLTQIEVIIEK
jgi:hypothetical protein